MIRINLPSNFLSNEKLIDVYSKLSSSVTHKLLNLDVIIKKNDAVIVINKMNIFELLTSKEFWMYTIYISDTDKQKIELNCIHDFLSLPTHTKSHSLINPKSNANKKVQQFYKKYNKSYFYQILKQNFSNSITMTFKAKCEFIYKFYPDYAQIKKIFNYKNITNEDRHLIITNMNVPVCPYCNINYTINFNKHGKRTATADLDHFYVKSKYPEYSLCLFNFVPSCQVCNSRLKLDKSMTVESHIYPHKNSFGESGIFKATNIPQLIMGVSSSPNIILEYNEEKVKNSNDMFMIEARHKEFNNIVYNLVNKVKEYNETYCEELSELFENTNIKTLVFGTKLSEDEMLQVSLGKLNNDILTQLGIYK